MDETKRESRIETAKELKNFLVFTMEAVEREKIPSSVGLAVLAISQEISRLMAW